MLAATCALALAAGAGCSGDDSDSGDDESAQSQAVPAPEPPAAMEGTDAKAAKAFVTYYWAIVNHAETTGDTATLRDLAGDACGPCDDRASQIETVHDDGGSVTGGIAEVQGVQVLDGDPADEAGDASTYDLIVDLQVTERSVTASKGAEAVSAPGGYRTLDFMVSHDGDHWQVDRWQSPTPE